jgi:hypothetical protein
LIIFAFTLKNIKMKEIFRELAQDFRENPKEVLGGVAFMAALIVLLWGGLWFAAIVEGRV